MNFKSFFIIIILSVCIVNADLTGYNRMLNRYDRHIGQRRDINRFKIKKKLIDQYVLFFKMTYQTNLLKKFNFVKNSVKLPLSK